MIGGNPSSLNDVLLYQDRVFVIEVFKNDVVVFRRTVSGGVSAHYAGTEIWRDEFHAGHCGSVESTYHSQTLHHDR